MKRRYDRDYSCPPRTRPNWFILFFIMVAIFFFSYFGKRLSQNTLKVAYNFPVKDVFTGSITSITKFRGKYLVLSFVILDCEPCEWQLKELNKISNSFRDVKVVAIFLDPDERSVKEFVDNRFKFNVFTIFHGDVELVVRKYNLKRVPTLFLIDKLGRIRRFYEKPVTASELKDVIKVVRRFGV